MQGVPKFNTRFRRQFFHPVRRFSRSQNVCFATLASTIAARGVADRYSGRNHSRPNGSSRHTSKIPSPKTTLLTQSKFYPFIPIGRAGLVKVENLDSSFVKKLFLSARKSPGPDPWNGSNLIYSRACRVDHTGRCPYRFKLSASRKGEAKVGRVPSFLRPTRAEFALGYRHSQPTLHFAGVLASEYAAF